MSDKAILITGASGRIGMVLIRAMLERDMKVIAVAGSEPGVQRLHSAYSNHAQSESLHIVVQDLTQTDAVESLIRQIQTLGIPVCGLINGARSKTFLRADEAGVVSESDFLAEYHLGVVTPYRLIHALVQHFPEELESVVNLASMYGVVAPTPQLYENFEQTSFPHYGVTKAALIHLTREMAVRLAPHKVRVNCVSYGGIEGNADTAFKSRYAKLVPMGTMLEESDVAGPTLFLLSSESSAITGHNLNADGGWTIW